MALLDNGKVYTWGTLKHTDKYEVPELMTSFSDYFITDICSRRLHTLLLTRNGEVLSFILKNNFSNAEQIQPVKIFLLNKTIQLSSGYGHSVALQENGEIIGWGSNNWGQLGVEQSESRHQQEKISVPAIKEVSCGMFCTFMLSIDGDIYFCGDIHLCLSHYKPTKLNKSTKFIKIAASIHSDLFVGLSTENKCFIFGRHVKSVKVLKKTKFSSIDETFAYYEQITYKTIEINSDKKFNNMFMELCSIGSGGFSTVFKSQHSIDNKYYAIKKVSFKPENESNVTKELRFLSDLNSDFIVNYIDSWIESNYYIDMFDENNKPQNISSSNLLYSPNLPLLLHIQMELCPLTLRDAIKQIKNKNKSQDYSLSLVAYYVTSELFYELLECVEYLHSRTPPIIHRDLKPENVLITYYENKRCVKLSDFGLSTFHEFAEQSHTKYTGTKNYRAFEVNSTSKYTTRADIYSLGIILQEMFHINCGNNEKLISALETKISYLQTLVQMLVAYIPEQRPNCEEVLANTESWLLKEDEIKKDRKFQEIYNSSKNASIDESFIDYFIQIKFKTEIDNLKLETRNNNTM